MTLFNSTALSRVMGDAETFGYSLAMGKDAQSDMGNRLFRAIIGDDTVTLGEKGAQVLAIADELYSAVRGCAVAIGLSKGRPMKDQSAKSKASQVSKLANFPAMAVYARANDAVETAYEFARTESANGYTKLVKCLVAMKDALVRDPLVGEPVLMQAVRDALTSEPELASVEIDALAAKLETLVRGDGKGEPSPHAAIFATLANASKLDYVEHAISTLEQIARELRVIEAAADAAKGRAK